MPMLQRHHLRLLAAAAHAIALFLSIAQPSAAASAAPASAAPVPDFNRDIRPILSSKCWHCHGPDEKERKGPKGGLRLDTFEGATRDLGGHAAIVPGNPAASDLIKRITTSDPDDVMPPPKMKKKLTATEIDLFQRWIAGGAKFARHWAYEKPERPAFPTTKLKDWARSGLDHFILARLEREGLRPQAEADCYTLARRVALDLTGLPPTPAEVDAFVADKSSTAYEAFVDRQLNKPAFGEHWARMWLDLARYADSAGYADDPPRVIWAFRDYVINAFNRNLPFDQFTIEQLAGDLLDNPTDEQLKATAFHRNTMTNNEGGTNDEEWRNAAIVDRVATTSSVWLGSSLNCAQCHTHKYDPFSQKEYYQFFAFLNNTADADKRDESPLFEFYTAEQKERKAKLESERQQLDDKFKQPPPAWLSGFAKWEQSFPVKLDWHTPASPTAKSKAGTKITARADGALLAAKGEAKDTYTVTLPLKAGKLSAVRLEALTDKSLTDGGPGNGAKGKFTLTQITGTVKAPSSGATAQGRYVRIELPNPGKRHLQLAEVQVFSGTENIALKGTAKQSTTGFEGEAKRAIDGKTDGDYFKGNSVSHTAAGDANPWWEVDLQSVRAIDRIVVWSRTDGRSEELNNFRVRVLDELREPTFERTVKDQPKPNAEVGPGGSESVKFITAIASAGTDAEAVLSGSDKNKGWSHSGSAATLTLIAEKPLTVAEGATLTLTLEHSAGPANQTLGAFRLSITGDNGAAEQARTPANVVTVLTTAADKRTPAQQTELREHYVRKLAPEAKTERDRAAAVTKELADLKPATVPVNRELAGDQRRKTRIQNRGNWQDLGEEVTEAVPVSLHPLPKDAPRNRLTLARWVVDDNNPLTARVIANRFWEHTFGSGIVRTSEEFGSQGELPSHPEMLDWLATEMLRLRWDTKGFLKLLVTSSAYRQSSKLNEELLERDPDNRLLSRGPRVRMSAEVIRDHALAVSGLLSPKMLGPSVRPPRPALGLNAAFGRNMDWETSPGEDRYRRALYTEVRRTSPYPSMATFDAPNREVCTVRRTRTNTPLQALVTLNDPVYVEAAQAVARRLVTEGGATTADRVRHGVRLCLSRPATEAEVARLVKLHATAHATFKADPEAAKKMATDPLGPLPATMDPADLAAWTTVANVLLNLDEVVMKR